MITSRLSTKLRTTIAQAVRKALRLIPGDLIEYEIVDAGRVVMKRAEPSHECPPPPTEKAISPRPWDDFFLSESTDIPERQPPSEDQREG